MSRRELLSLFNGAAFTWPLNARAQMPDIPMLGFLDSSVAIRAKLAAYYEGLRIEGFFRNQNVMFEYHSAEGNYDRLPALAADKAVYVVVHANHPRELTPAARAACARMADAGLVLLGQSVLLAGVSGSQPAEGETTRALRTVPSAPEATISAIRSSS